METKKTTGSLYMSLFLSGYSYKRGENKVSINQKLEAMREKKLVFNF